MGDIGNIKKEYKVNWASLSTEDPMIQLSGSYRIIGRTLVVHAADDDFGKGLFEDSKEEGHAGPVVAFGIIGHSAPFQYAQPGEKVPEEIREEEEQRKKI
jgi:Cu-Zn family superoxide dismutase